MIYLRSWGFTLITQELLYLIASVFLSLDEEEESEESSEEESSLESDEDESGSEDEVFDDLSAQQVSGIKPCILCDVWLSDNIKKVSFGFSLSHNI